MTDSNIALSAYTRVWLIEGGARPDHTPTYESCLRLTALTWGLGDIEPVYCPDPYNSGKFVEKAQIRGETERATTTLEGRLPMDLLSKLVRFARKGCSFDVQLHMGTCTDPSSFNTYDKVIMLPNAFLTNYSTEDLGALTPGDNAAINESGDISSKEVYEVVPLSTASRFGSQVTNEVIDVVICDSISCGECTTESDGCKKIFAITKAAGGSPGTPPDILFSLDKGLTAYVHDIEELTSAQDPSAIECLGDYVVVVSNAANSLVYVLKSELDGIVDPDWQEITTGFVAGGEPNDIWSTGRYAFIVGDAGYVYGTDDPAAGVTVLDAGAATDQALRCVHGLSDTFAVAAGDNGVIVYTQDGSTFQQLLTSPVGLGIVINTVWVKSEDEWWIGCSNGRLYYTLNAGATWTLKAFSTAAGTGSVLDIVFSTTSVGFLSHQTAATKGNVYKTIDGGNSWKLEPSKSGVMPYNDKINALGYCTYDPNFFVGVGLADDGSDGFVVVGNAS